MNTNSDFYLTDITNRLKHSEELTGSDVMLIGKALIGESVSLAEKKEFLLAWQAKGETPDEVAALANFFRDEAADPTLGEFADRAIDIVGTGGDKAGTFNISTTTAIVAAAGGVPVIKHGNRSITSKTGSADLLESLGIPLTADPELLKRSLENHNFTFLFAPAFHPAFKNIMPVRKELAMEGKKTVFNILGPLINPARPKSQLMGVFAENWVKPLSSTFNKMGLKRGIVAHSTYNGQAMDEITSIGKNTLGAVGEISANDIQSAEALIQTHKGGNLGDLRGGDSKENLQIFDNILNFKANKPLLNTICINAGIAFYLANNVKNCKEGFEKATNLLKSGAVKAWRTEVQSFYKK